MFPIRATADGNVIYEDDDKPCQHDFLYYKVTDMPDMFEICCMSCDAFIGIIHRLEMPAPEPPAKPLSDVAF